MEGRAHVCTSFVHMRACVCKVLSESLNHRYACVFLCMQDLAESMKQLQNQQNMLSRQVSPAHCFVLARWL